MSCCNCCQCRSRDRGYRPYPHFHLAGPDLEEVAPKMEYDSEPCDTHNLLFSVSRLPVYCGLSRMPENPDGLNYIRAWRDKVKLIFTRSGRNVQLYFTPEELKNLASNLTDAASLYEEYMEEAET